MEARRAGLDAALSWIVNSIKTIHIFDLHLIRLLLLWRKEENKTMSCTSFKNNCSIIAN